MANENVRRKGLFVLPREGYTTTHRLGVYEIYGRETKIIHVIMRDYRPRKV